jgi:hypothetical protein
MLYDEQYARMINSSYVVPTCGTIAREVVRKHFEIPACNACLVTERTAALEAAGFADMQNCVFATEENILDKLEYLFEKPDVLEGITRSGHLLVHSQHTARQRNQILQWLELHNSLKPGQRIIQSDPFGPFTIVDVGSKVTNFLALSSGVDRALLRKADMHLRRGQYTEAERYYLSCLNYHVMPEPILGLTLCNLYKGDARKAEKWISQSIGEGMEIHNAADPDPVEWAYFIISLLCQGDIREAKRRANQFALLQHQELERCKWVVDILNGSTLSSSKEHHNKTGVIARPSLHQLPQRDMASWVRELCRMLTACQESALAAQVHKRFLLHGTRSVLRSHCVENAGTKPLIELVRSKSILPLSRKPFGGRIRGRIRRWIPSRMRAQMRRLFVSLPLLRKNRTHDFADVTQAWAREEPAGSALILGASDRSTYTSAFLSGIRQNPSMPKVCCVGPSNYHLKKLERKFAENSQIQFTSRPLHTLLKGAKAECFDIALIDDYAPDEKESLELLTGIKTILVGNVNTYPGFVIGQNLLSEGNYHIAYEDMTGFTRSIIFTKKHLVARTRKAVAGANSCVTNVFQRK